MIERQLINSERAPRPVGPYSQALLSGDFVFISGQVGLDPHTGKIAGDTIEAQTRQCLESIGALLKAAGCSYNNVLKTTSFIAESAHFSGFNEVYAEYFSEPYPARSTVVCGLPVEGLLVEIEVIARRST